VLASEEFSTRDQGDRRGAVVDTMVQVLQFAVDQECSVASVKIISGSSSAVIERAAAIIGSALNLGTTERSEVDHIATCGDSPCPRCDPLAATR
jgi:hypothetical protein